MNNWIDDYNTICPNDENREYAKYVCHKLDIQFKEISFHKSYWNHVFRFDIKLSFSFRNQFNFYSKLKIISIIYVFANAPNL
jgi:hypothetical protein